MYRKYRSKAKENVFGLIGCGLLLLIVGLAIFGSFLVSYNPKTPSTIIFAPPSSKHWLGTNHLGQDIWSRLVHGARSSLCVAFGVGFFSTALSTLLGASAALIGGMYERILMRLVDVFLAIPMILLIILVSARISAGFWILIVLISILTWQGGARIVRAQTLSLKERMYISAARTFGGNNFYLLKRHILPELSPILFILFINSARSGVFIEAGLAFLGIGDPSVISWGRMIHHAFKFYYLDIWKWWLLPVGLSLSLTLLALLFIGYNLETNLNPRLRRD